MNLLIGVDGGGTKTELILIDQSGATLATHTAPGCNPSQLGPEGARTMLTEALRALLAKSKIGNPKSKITRTQLCMAGSSLFWREFAAALADHGRVSAADDSLPVLELATDGQPGLVLHSGTGSFVAARAPDGSIHYAGGLGWRFGDPGSGSDLGRRGTALALLELQARRGDAPLSPLAAALCAHTGIPDYASNSRFFYNDPAANAVIATFTPRVIELAEKDAGPARQVVIDSVSEFARNADDVIRRLFPRPSGKLPCGISGRILNTPLAAATLRSLVERLSWPVKLRCFDTAPIEGVRRLLLRDS